MNFIKSCIENFLSTMAISSSSLLPNIDSFVLPRDVDLTKITLEFPPRLMLGKRAERIFAYLIALSEEYELLAENIQVIDQKNTLGEFDFIVKRLSDDQIIHVELIYKFYLFDPQTSEELEHWIGPNRNDQLTFKLEKLRNHQFPLLKTEAGRRSLKEIGLEVDDMKQEVCFLANLFVPESGKIDFERINPKGIEGKWMRFGEFHTQHIEGNTYSMAPKTDWFLRTLDINDWRSLEEIKSEIREMLELKKSPLIWIKDRDNNQRRCFVVCW